MIRTPGQAIDYVRRHAVVTMTKTPGTPSLIEAITGEPLKGSWWSHREGGLIFRLSNAVHDSKEVLAMKLIDGKVTFVHASRWPALARLVTDTAWKAPLLARLSPGAARLLRSIEKKGARRLEREEIKSGKELERALLVHGGSEHTERGAHATVLTSWKRIFDSRTLKSAAEMTLEEARALLRLPIWTLSSQGLFRNARHRSG